MEGPGAGRKAGKQVNYARKLGQSGSRDIIEYTYFFSVIPCSSYDHTDITTDENIWEKMTLVVYTFLLSNIVHCQRGRGEAEKVLGIRLE